MAKMPGRPGRKPRRANQGERVSLGLKVTPAIKNQLDAEAKRNGRTQSQEAEARLENSFRNERVLDEAIDLGFGRINGDLLISAFGMIMNTASKASSALTDYNHWIDDKDTLRSTVLIIKSLFDALEKPGTVHDDRVSLSAQFMRREILRIIGDEEWLKQRHERLNFRAVLLENWRKTLKCQIDAEASKPLDIVALSRHIAILDDDINQPRNSSKREPE
jgi:TraY domain